MANYTPTMSVVAEPPRAIICCRTAHRVHHSADKIGSWSSDCDRVRLRMVRGMTCRSGYHPGGCTANQGQPKLAFILQFEPEVVNETEFLGAGVPAQTLLGLKRSAYRLRESEELAVQKEHGG